MNLHEVHKKTWDATRFEIGDLPLVAFDMRCLGMTTELSIIVLAILTTW